MRSWRRRQSHSRVRLRLCVHQLNKCVVECLSAEEKSSRVRQYTAECASAEQGSKVQEQQLPSFSACHRWRQPPLQELTGLNGLTTCYATYDQQLSGSNGSVMQHVVIKIWDSQTNWSYKLKFALPWEEEEKVPYGQIIPLSFSLYFPGPALFGMSQSSHHIKRQGSLITNRMHALNNSLDLDPDLFYKRFPS